MTTLRFDGPGAPRLDAWLKKSCPALAGGLLYKYHRQNRVKLNGKRRPLDTQLAPGDAIQLYLPDEKGGAEAPPLAVLYEDEALLAVVKPAGLLCQPEGGGQTAGGPDGTAEPDTLLARIQRYLGAGPAPGGESGKTAGGEGGGKGGKPGSGADRGAGAGNNRGAAGAAGEEGHFAPRLCHRLDTGTSGIVLAAKTEAALDWVGTLLRARLLRKTYLGATVGHPAPAAGSIRNWLIKDSAQGLVRALDAPAPGAKPAETAYATLATSGPLALVQLNPATGRTHQLRVHMAGLGTPLLGDGKYGDNTQNRIRRCKYQCLCAWRLDFPKQVEEAAFARYAGLRLECPPPWFYGQLLDGSLK